LLQLIVVASALLYVRGVAMLWRHAGRGRGIRTGQAVRFAMGWIALAAALLSPIDEIADRSFAAHMVQHELLMVVAAPLLVLGRPLEAWAWALPSAWVRAFANVGRMRLLARPWAAITDPLGAWIFHAAALWLWHLPVLFTAALADERLHVLQHACFFGSALAFWWAVFGRGAHGPDGASIASLFTTMLHTSALGALLTFAPAPWYDAYASATPWGLTPLEDQQLGGLVMWVPAGFAYVAAGLAIVAAWLRQPEPRFR
jgi:putative membrane protein